MRSQTLSLGIDSVAAGGDGVARADGLVVFVPRTAPGDAITARVSGRGSFARGRVVSIDRPSAERVEPPCPHYTRDDCGGCQLQHMAYTAQLEAKRRIVRDAIERIGRRSADVEPVRPSPAEWRYRSRLTLALRRGADGRWIAGLHPYDHPVRIFQVEDCLISESPVIEAWRDVLSQSRFFPPVPELRGTVRSTPDGLVFVLAGEGGWPNAQAFFDSLPGLAAVWWEREGRVRRLVGDRRSTSSTGAPSASFAQVNTGLAVDLRNHVIATLLRYSPRVIVDAYSGAGDTAIPLAGAGARVTAIELDADAADWCADRLPAGSLSIHGRVEDELPRAFPADAVVMNPPRAGAGAEVTAALQTAEPRPRVVVYVSCNPATLARDIARLPAYRIGSVVPFDMFPQTAHVETVCELVSEAA